MKPNSLNRPDLNKETLAKVASEVAKRKPREVPTVYRGGVLQIEWFRKFTFWERIQILFGCNMVVASGIACQHSAGKFQPIIVGRVSYDKNATNHMKSVCSAMLAAQEPKAPVEHEPKGKP